ncbi:S-layer homology domain-containing protein [Texcoconibacillus texcoconensis]|uniref:SLH domain-containing protein n=1 Tax=Texcoconibacillus texcoconensis TaxID=1095777 RepID=A0A840QTI8_9BACI|nr:S-layer homology domain-containing protein [Texcoconibacillus texcoconensis]MBB5174587.1 hypothetical protein [Texcoconibacillus texcoconensis]
MAYQPKSYRKFLATSVATALVATTGAGAVTAADAQISDVQVSDWFADSVNYTAEKGIIEGYEDGTFRPDEQLTRAQAASMIAGAFNLDIQEDADADFSDVDDEWFAAEVAAVAEAGYIQGYEDGTFRPDNNITRAELADIVVAAYELEENEAAILDLNDVDGHWGEAAVKALASLGIVQGYGDGEFKPDAEVNRAEAATFFHRTEAPEERLDVEVDVLEVAEVSATNLKEIDIYFNQDVEDVEDIEDEIELLDEDGSELDLDDDVDPVVDGNHVRLTLDDAKENQDQVTVKVSDEVLEEEYETTIELFDTTVPTAEEVEVTGTNEIEVVFSEPIDVDNSDEGDAFTVETNNGTTLIIDSVSFDDSERVATIELLSSLEDGEYEVSVERGELVDYAGLNVPSTTFDLDVTIDENPPVIEEAYAENQQYVVVQFNENISFEDSSEEEIETGDADASILDKIYHTNSSNTADKVEIDGSELHVWFDADHTLPSGSANLTIEEEVLEDNWGNVQEDELTTSFEVTVDEDAPTIASVEQEEDSQDSFKVEFDKDLADSGDEAGDNRSNYSLVDEDGDDVSINSVDFYVDDDGDTHYDTVVVTVDNDAYGDHVLTVEDVEDTLGNELDEEDFTFEMQDVTAPDASNFDVKYYQDGDDVTIVVEFDDNEMATTGDYSVADLSKYSTDNTSFDELDTAEISVADDLKSVEITFDNAEEELALIGDLTGARVADANGNRTDDLYWTENLGSDQSGTPFGIDQNDDGDDLMTALDRNTIELQFEDDIDEFDVEEFTLQQDSSPYDELKINSVSTTSSNTVELTIEEDLDTNGQYKGEDVEVIADGSGDTVNRFGQPLQFTETGLINEIAPEIDNVQLTEADEVTVNFSEEMNGTRIDDRTFSVEGAEVDSVDHATDGTKAVVLELDEELSLDEAPEVTVERPEDLEDTAGNVIEETEIDEDDASVADDLIVGSFDINDIPTIGQDDNLVAQLQNVEDADGVAFDGEVDVEGVIVDSEGNEIDSQTVTHDFDVDSNVEFDDIDTEIEAASDYELVITIQDETEDDTFEIEQVVSTLTFDENSVDITNGDQDVEFELTLLDAAGDAIEESNVIDVPDFEDEGEIDSLGGDNNGSVSTDSEGVATISLTGLDTNAATEETVEVTFTTTDVNGHGTTDIELDFVVEDDEFKGVSVAE